MSVKVAINGTGRIGLCTARIIGKREDIDLVALNTTAPIDTLVHLLRYDSVHRGYEVQKLDEHTIQIGKDKVAILSDRDPAKLDFSAHGAQGVIECTGKFNSLQASSAHLRGSVQKVIISAALMTTIHSYTNDQNVLDVKHKDIRRARAAALNIIPTSSGAAKAVGLVIPELAGRFNGFAVRVPTPDVSLVDLSVNLSKAADKDAINELFRQVQHTSMKGIIYVDEEKCVSSDFIGSPYSAIFVPDKTLVIGKSAKVLAWYDNEMGYSARLVDMSVYALTH